PRWRRQARRGRRAHGGCGGGGRPTLRANPRPSPADGGEIRIRLGDRRLSVENQGPAIPPERLPRLFDRFYRADPARREGQGEHAGLGLAICRSIVQAHGGEIRCESADGWTRFVIDFARPRR
ncbi:ATP-binding protein, partial [Pseudomonas aeruginosa]|uniref:ATP-binding protein n=1 Tax=Pseudomonas aeruginosa TaxID=287 RepID=UPI001FF3D2AA